MSKFPQFSTRSQLKRIVALCRKSHLRVGQAVCNKYEVSKEVESQIYECDDFNKAVEILYRAYIRPDYHNVGE